MRPEEALAAARAAAEDARAAGDGPENLPGLRVEGSRRVSTEQLMEYAVIEPDTDLMRSTRVWGRPITAAKRTLLHILRQYTRELHAQDTRFNFHAALRIAELEERVLELEAKLAGRDDEA